MSFQTFKLEKPIKYYSWTDKRTQEEILKDIEARKKRKDQIRLEHFLSSPENFNSRRT